MGEPRFADWIVMDFLCTTSFSLIEFALESRSSRFGHAYCTFFL